MSDGFPIVLTADRTLTADYRLLFDGMLAASQTTTAPPAVFGRLLMPQNNRGRARAKVAPLGLRRIEAALLAGGFSPDEVAVVTEDQLEGAIGRATRVIGISSGEPAGLGMNSSTMTAIAGGRIYPQAMFGRLMRKIRRLNRDVSAKVVLGGPGAWQVAGDPSARKALGVDHVVSGYADRDAAATFRRLMRARNPARDRDGRLGPGRPHSADSRGQHHGRGGDQPRLRAGLLVLHHRPRADGSSAAADHSRRRGDQRGRRPSLHRRAERRFLPLRRRRPEGQPRGPDRSVGRHPPAFPRSA